MSDEDKKALAELEEKLRKLSVEHHELENLKKAQEERLVALESRQEEINAKLDAVLAKMERLFKR